MQIILSNIHLRRIAITAVIFFICGLLSRISLLGPLYDVFAALATLAVIQLAGIWSVLGPGTFLRRSLWALLILAMLVLSGMLGKVIGGGTAPGLFGDKWKDLGLIVCWVPILWVTAQLPSWCLRLFFGWHITRGEENISAFRPTSIVDLMIFTAVFAIGLAAAQLGIYIGGPVKAFFTPVETYLIYQLVLITAVANLLICLPAVWVDLREQSNGIWPDFLVFVVCGSLLGAVLIYTSPETVFWKEALTLEVLLIVLFGICFFVLMKFVRDAGFVLRTRKP